MDFWREFWAWICLRRLKAAQERRRNMAALAPQYPPAGQTGGKTVTARARRNLPAGMRKRFGKEDAQ